ncbi:MAG: hypothetical protein H6834_18125 [Planctomycetes bacterium]|nr:hypothetical protein [Planctomycetota bacterium]
MQRLTLSILAAAATAAALGAQAKTLLFTGRYDMVSTEGGQTILDAIRGHDIAAVTPGAGATAWSMIPSTSIQAMAGDIDGDGSVSQLSGVLSYSSGAFDICGPFVKWADKTNFSPSKVFFTVQVYSGTSATLTVAANNKPVALRPGDFVRFLPSGEVEYFITQDLIMKAAGTQTGAWAPGANCLTQDKDGNLYFSPAYGVTNSGGGPAGGIWIEKGLPSGTHYTYDAGIVAIDKADITYDAKGNVVDVKAASAKVVMNEINNPTNQPNVRDLCKNSGAKDDLGCPTDITFWMGGLDIDPNGGTFVDWNNITRPNLIFTVVRSAFQTCGSWKGTVHSTAMYQQQLGSIAVVNGVQLGSMTKADASWLGLQDSQTLAASPLLQGLCWVEGGYNVKAPYGFPVGDAGGKDGVFTVGTDPTVDLAVQGVTARFPVAAISFGGGATKGGNLVGVDVSATLGGWQYFYPPIGWTVFPGGATDAKGQVSYNFPLPNDPTLKGVNLSWQFVTFNQSQGLDVTPPVSTEFN